MQTRRKSQKQSEKKRLNLGGFNLRNVTFVISLIKKTEKRHPFGYLFRYTSFIILKTNTTQWKYSGQILWLYPIWRYYKYGQSWRRWWWFCILWAKSASGDRRQACEFAKAVSAFITVVALVVNMPGARIGLFIARYRLISCSYRDESPREMQADGG